MFRTRCLCLIFLPQRVENLQTIEGEFYARPLACAGSAVQLVRYAKAGGLMEQSLTLLVRMLVVAFVGISVWLVLDSTSNQMAKKLFNRSAPESPAPPALPNSPAPEISPIPLIGGLIAVLAATGGIEFFFYRRFEAVVQQIRTLKGSIRFAPDSESLYLSFRQGTPTVDLSDCDISDANFPALSRLPRLSSLRVCQTDIGEKSLTEISKCSTLRSLDLSQTNFTQEQLEVLNRISSLEKLLFEND